MPTERTNEAWITELGRPDGAVEELRGYLRGALAKAVGGRADVDENDLDDFAQEGIVRVLQGLDSFRGDSRLTTWATAVAVRAAFDALRRRRAPHHALEELDQGLVRRDASDRATAGDPAEALERGSLLEALSEAIDQRLTDRQRFAVLGELDGASSRELSERLGTNPNALYKLHHDARKKLKQALIEAGFGDRDVRGTLVGASEVA